MTDVDRRAYIRAVLVAAATGGCSAFETDVTGTSSTEYPPEHPDRSPDGPKGEIYFELDVERLRAAQPSPGDFDVGVTAADGPFAGKGGQWVAVRDAFGTYDATVDAGRPSPRVVSNVIQLTTAVADESVGGIVLTPGRYDLSGRGPLTLDSGTSLVCQPRTATVVGPTDTTVIEAESANDIYLYGLDVQYSQRTGITHGNGILTAGCRDVTVENCRVRGARRHGIYLRASDQRDAENLVVRECEVAHCDGAGIVVEAVGVDGSAQNYVVDGNYVHDIGRTDDYLNGTGIACEAITRGVVTNNRVENVSRDGIRAHDATMVGNVVVDAAQGPDENRTYFWITAEPANYQPIHGNVAYAATANPNTAIGIRATVDDVTVTRNGFAVTGNVVRDDGGNIANGIEVGSNSTSVVGNNVRGATFYGVKIGLFEQRVSNVAVFGNVADDCKDGISSDFDVSNLVVGFNVCTDNRDAGIRLRNTSDATVVYNVLTYNGVPIGDGGGNSNVTETGNR